jgi:hypothetical protein
VKSKSENAAVGFRVKSGLGERCFACGLEQALDANRIGTLVLKERDAYAQAASQLRKSIVQVRRAIQTLGPTKGAWRTEQKLAALAAHASL